MLIGYSAVSFLNPGLVCRSRVRRQSYVARRRNSSDSIACPEDWARFRPSHKCQYLDCQLACTPAPTGMKLVMLHFTGASFPASNRLEVDLGYSPSEMDVFTSSSADCCRTRRCIVACSVAAQRAGFIEHLRTVHVALSPNHDSFCNENVRIEPRSSRWAYVALEHIFQWRT